MLAIADGKLSIIQYLLKNGADTEITDYRQGSHKIRSFQIETFRILVRLLDRDWDPTNWKQKAADWAEERGNHEALSYITKHDQDKRKFGWGLSQLTSYRGQNDGKRYWICYEKRRNEYKP